VFNSLKSPAWRGKAQQSTTTKDSRIPNNHDPPRGRSLFVIAVLLGRSLFLCHGLKLKRIHPTRVLILK
jgi:hypothetical protein